MSLKDLCKEKGYTLTDISLKTNITVDYLSKLNTGKRNNPGAEIVKRISIALGVSSDEVINSIL